MEIGGAMVEPKFDAVHVWKPKVPVIIERMEDFLARRREKVLVEVEVLETHLSCPTDVEGVIGVLAWKACDHEGRRRAMRTREGTLVANVGQYAMLRGRQDAEYLELHEIIEYINEKRWRLLVTIERKQKLMSGASETFREHLFQEIRDVDDRISA